ncbi:MAG: VanZ family protein [Lactimicrobium sp.]|jgi:glycopeptide antibiotics resistance protein|uniref:VanZ family protein n=1 Tax=Lactimicrobium sp. TaxID=2563780 RepID=UPI002F35044D
MQYLLQVLPAIPAVLAVTCGLYFFLAHQWKERYKAQSRGVKIAAFFLTGWLVMFIYVTQIMSFGNGMGQLINLRPLHDFYIAWRYGSDNAQGIWQFLLNIIMFVPLGLLLPIVSKKYRCWHRTICAAFVLSLATEVLQLISMRGTDIDDLIANTLGGVMGYALFVICQQISLKKQAETKNVHVGHAQLVISVLVIALILLPFAGIRMLDGSTPYGSLYYGHLMPQKVKIETDISDQETDGKVYKYTEQISLSDLQDKLLASSGLSGTWQDGDGSSYVSRLLDGDAAIYIYNYRKWDVILADDGHSTAKLSLDALKQYAETDMEQYGIAADEVTFVKMPFLHSGSAKHTIVLAHRA